MRTVYIKNSESVEKTSTKHEYEYYILKKKKPLEIKGFSENSHP